MQLNILWQTCRKHEKTMESHHAINRKINHVYGYVQWQTATVITRGYPIARSVEQLSPRSPAAPGLQCDAAFGCTVLSLTDLLKDHIFKGA